MLTNMVIAGEETGALDEMLEKVVDFYESKVDATGKELTSLV
jgi:type IV pilus assembly protein PilC